MRFQTILIILAICGWLVTPRGLVAPIHATAQTVVINELLWMGSSASSADEWIELRNMTDQTVDISNWQWTKKSSGLEVAMLTLPSGAIILPNGFFLISNYANTNTSSTLNMVPNFVTTDVALSNSAMQIKLYDGAHVLVDSADDGVGNPLAGAYDSGKKLYASMERNPIPGDGALGQSWHSASRSLGFKIGSTELGTPGSENSNGIPIAEAGIDRTVVVGEAVNFDASDSVDPEQQPLTFDWNFGDGATSTEPTPKHAYAAAGAYTATLIVSDGVDSASDVVTITVQPPPAPATTTTSPNPSSPEEGNQPMTSCKGLQLSELYPNPPGVDNDEFIELVNTADEDMPVAGCSIWTTATRKFVMKDATIVPRGGFYVLKKLQSKLTLNNGGTTVRLVDSDGAGLEQVKYGNAVEGSTWANIDGTWRWTTKPTPGEKNAFITAAVKTTKTTPAKKSATTTTKKKIVEPAQPVALSGLQELDSGDRVSIHGIVISPRDALGSTLIAMQSDAGGVMVSIPNGEPTVKVGQTISVTGTVRLKQGRRYVTAEAKGVKTSSAVISITPVILPTDDVGVEQADQLVQVKGVVGLASGNTVQIDDGSGPVNVYLKSSTGIVRPKIKAGDSLSVVGVVGVSTSGVRVLPRMQADLRVEKVLGAATSTVSTTLTAPVNSKSQTLWYWSLVALGGLAAGARPMWKALRGRGIKD